MIVGVVPTGAGIVPVRNQFFEAASVADGVSAYANGYTPPRNPADYLGFDTGWTAYTPNTPGKEWSYDRTNSLLLEADLPPTPSPLSFPSYAQASLPPASLGDFQVAIVDDLLPPVPVFTWRGAWLRFSNGLPI